MKFDNRNYCTIYHDKDGFNDLKWGVRISFCYTLLNGFLFLTEYTNPGK